MKRCPYCRRLFKPDPRSAYEQRACSAAECRKQRKRDAQKKWREKNPTYFHDHYRAQVKKWLDKHPGYLKNYRQNNRNYVGVNEKEEKRRMAINVTGDHAGLEVRVVEMERFFRHLPCCDIKDTIEAKSIDLKPFCAQFTQC